MTTTTDVAQAESCFEESLALYQEIGNTCAAPDLLVLLWSHIWELMAT